MRNLGEYANIATVLQGIAVVPALVLVLVQLHQSNQLAKAANSNTLVEQAATFNTHLIEHPELAEVWYKFGRGLDKPMQTLHYREFADTVANLPRKYLLSESAWPLTR